MISKLGYEVILSVHPKFTELFQDLQKIRERIIEI